MGGVLAGAGLVVVSQMTPLERRTGVEAELAAEVPVAEVPKTPVSGAASDAPDLPGQDPAQPKPAEPEAPGEALLRPAPEENQPAPATIVPDLPSATAPEGQVPVAESAVAEKTDPAVPSEAPAISAPEAAALEEKIASAAPAEGATEAQPETETAAVVPSAPETKDEEIAPAAEAQTAPAVEPAPAASPETVAEPKIETAEESDAAPGVSPLIDGAAGVLAPDGGLQDKTVAGVKTGRLPAIGKDTPAEGAAADTAAIDPAALPPVARYARTFENPSAKPLFAVMLIDPGSKDLNRADLAALPFPVTFVIDPLSETASEAAAIYRAGGQEVVMLASGIPAGAKAADLEQSFAALAGTLPEAVALIDTADAKFQNDRGLAAEVVTLLGAEGRGLITFDRGLNAADQVARREGVPAATIFRSLDDDGEDAPLIRRYLDRAAFKAAQEGQVVVIGTAREDTIAALMEWAIEGRSASVALAPITAVMASQ